MNGSVSELLHVSRKAALQNKKNADWLGIMNFVRNGQQRFLGMSSPSLHFRLAAEEHRAQITKIELESYPDDEAASPHGIAKRMQEAGAFFFACVKDDGSVVGFVNGTLSSEQSLTHDSMSKHDPAGSLLCVHSLCVHEGVRRSGIGSKMLKNYVEMVKATQPAVTCIALICKKYLIAFYEGCGFKLIGPSPVVHGQDPWFEMRLETKQ